MNPLHFMRVFCKLAYNIKQEKCKDKTLKSDCWIWIGGKDRDGYGRVQFNYKKYSVHRLVWQIHHGPIIEGLELDHLCGVRACCNPEHLEPVTHQINIARGNSGKLERERTHCPQGHPYNEENTYISKNRPSNRICRICRREKKRKPK